MAHVGVGKTGTEVGGADILGHTDANALGGAGIAVGHVGGGLFAMGDDAADVHVLHLAHDAEEGGGDLEDMGHAVVAEHFRNESVAGHSGHGAHLRDLVGLREQASSVGWPSSEGR